MALTLFQENFLALRETHPAVATLLEIALARRPTYPPLRKEPAGELAGTLEYEEGGIFTGAPARALFTRLLASPKLHWIVPDLADLVRAAAGVDLAGPLRAGRLRAFAGPDWQTEWRAFLAQAPFPNWPIVFLRRNSPIERWLPAIDPALHAAIGVVFEVYRKRIAPAQARVAALYERPTNWNEILGAGGRPPRVLGLSPELSEYQRFGMRDLVDGFRAAGWEAQGFAIAPQLGMHELLARIEVQRPDLLVLFSNLHLALEDMPPRAIPRLVWDQDECLVLAQERWDRLFRPHDRAFLMIEEWGERIGAHPTAPRCLPMAANAGLYRPVELSIDDRAKYRAPVVFVGNFQPDYLARYVTKDLAPPLRDVLIEAHDDLIRGIPAEADRLFPDPRLVLECALRRRGVLLAAPEFERLHGRFFYRIVHQAIRVPYLEVLAPFGLALWGKGWDQVPTLKSSHRGIVENGAELNKLMQAADVNLFLVAGTVCHPRLFDTLAAGAFLLAGHVTERREIGSYFETGREVAVFRSLADLREKVAYYLAHPEERRAMGCRARERVLRDHTFERRVRTIVEPALREADPTGPSAAGDFPSTRAGID